MRTRADYGRAFAAVRQVIHRWDPYGLISGGAPADEWDSEIASVVSQIPHIKSESDATRVISEVFSRAFQPVEFAFNCIDQSIEQAAACVVRSASHSYAASASLCALVVTWTRYFTFRDSVECPVECHVVYESRQTPVARAGFGPVSHPPGRGESP